MVSRLWKSKYRIAVLGVLALVAGLTWTVVRAVDRVRTAAARSADT